jgi:hypothetical protein
MANEPESEGVLTAAAQLIGKAAGKVATLAGAKAKVEEEPAAQPVKRRATAKAKTTGKLQKKVKTDPPRRLKKARKKARIAG